MLAFLSNTLTFRSNYSHSLRVPQLTHLAETGVSYHKLSARVSKLDAQPHCTRMLVVVNLTSPPLPTGAVNNSSKLNLALPNTFLRHAFALPTILSKNPPRQGALSKWNLHSILFLSSSLATSGCLKRLLSAFSDA